ncbi:ComEC/Rec2 family competence protein [Pseudoclavibacter sp. 13-3]|uniref:ComEC/Rec2 family competence protein n=1 Tax=Pseudoclavibacter sp. 13-3 TaxID=2901228 RepID=UPI001E63F950|nr:ComEC/Rec2 family competence protein [Pseudoclavibacter sp. 13-3]MCD7100617.1 ComEC/Rec2 family competence protein [Pseudoclavibacter sp. 13-3]
MSVLRRSLLASPQLIEWRHLGDVPADRPSWRPAMALLVVLAGWMAALGQGAGEPAARAELRERLDLFNPGWAQQMRAAFQDVLAELGQRLSVDAEVTGLIGGVSVGVVDGLPETTDANMLATGLSHVTAVSGSNVAVLVGLVQGLLGIMHTPRLWRGIGELSGIWGFALLVGGEITVLRAAAMLTLVTLMRPRSGGRGIVGICAAVLILLLWEPRLAGSVAFGLSVTATAGLMLFSEPVSRWLRRWMPETLANLLAPSAAALLVCQPLLLLIDGQPAAGHQLAANLLALPAVPAVTVLGVLSCLLAEWASPLAAAFALAAVPGGWWIGQVAAYFSAHPFGTVPWPPWPVGGITSGLLVALLAVGTLIGARRGPTPAAEPSAGGHRWRIRSSGDRTDCGRHHRGQPWRWRVRLFSFGGAVLVVIVTVAITGVGQVLSTSRLPVGTPLLQCDVGQGDGLLVQGGGATVLIDTGESPQQITDCLRGAQVSAIDVVVLTHSDIDHAGATEAVAKVAKVDTVLIPDVIDAKLDRSALRLQARQIVRAGLGDAGTIHPVSALAAWRSTAQRTPSGAGISWRALHPEKAAAHGEAVSRPVRDPNANGLAMLIDLPELRVLTLADLDAEAQRAVGRELSALGVRKIDVAKVAHHGSADHWPGLYSQLRPTLGLISCGDGNSYGHPAAKLLATLQRSGTVVRRTDQDGRVAVSVETREPGSAGRGASNPSESALGGQRLAVWCEHGC